MTIIGLPILCALGAGLVNIIVAVTVKGAEHHGCSPAKIGALSLTTGGLVALIVAWTQTGSWLDWRLWMLGVPTGVLCYACIKTMMRANGLGPPSLPWAMANLALVVPIALSALFLKEPLCWIDGVELAAFGGMLTAFVLGSSHAKDVAIGNRGRLILLLTLILVFNGFLMFGFKLNSLLPAEVNHSALPLVMYASGSLLSWMDELRKPRRKYLLREICWGGGMGIGNGTAILLLLVAMKLPAVVAFPIVQGVSFLGGICVTAVIFKEHLNRWKITGIILGLAVILLSVWR